MAHLLFVTATFYPEITDALVKGAAEACKKHGASYERIDVPGAFEIPAAISYAVANNKYDGFVALGCVIRGETSHYDIISNESARGLMELMTREHAAIGNGILTVENRDQAMRRADPAQGNKGSDAAEACLRLLEIKNQFSS